MFAGMCLLWFVFSVAPTMSDLTVYINSSESADGDAIIITEGTPLDFVCVISDSVTPVHTVFWDIGGVTFSGNSVTLKNITENTTATCSAFNDASSYTEGTVFKQVTITVAGKLGLEV